MPFCVGLTGGIGSGKSCAARMLEELGAAVVDTDQVAHELTQGGTPAMDAIRNAFGSQFLSPDGSLDRARMRRLVFDDPAARTRLEGILHPLIRTRVKEAMAAAEGAPYVVLVVPLLLETGAYGELVQRVLVVDCSEELQIERTIRRSHLSAEEIRAIMGAQLPRAARLERADDVLDNNADMDALRRQARALHARYLELAAGQ
jgi:dephospho-CoA kinase